MKVKIVGKTSTEKGWSIMDKQIGAVKVVFPTKFIIIWPNGKIEEHQEKESNE